MWKKGFVFTGKTPRKDFWIAYVIHIIVIVLLCIPFLFDSFEYYSINGIEITNTMNPIKWAYIIIFYGYLLLSLIPSLAISIRRLHDVGLSGWLMLIEFAHIVGSIVLVVLLVLPSSNKVNKYTLMERI